MEAKRFLAQHSIGYVEKDVVADRENMRELVTKYRVMKVPTIVVDGNLVVGFQQAKLKELLGVS
ncbi:MAG: thioredoxin family protein [Chloroflexi bacterium]|nr:thioredoxin family protein [Chloroflexota bacterium]